MFSFLISVILARGKKLYKYKGNGIFFFFSKSSIEKFLQDETMKYGIKNKSNDL